MEDNKLKEQLDRIESYAAMAAKSIFDVEMCALFTGYKRSHIYALTHQKRIPHYKQGAKVFFKREELEAWLTANKVNTYDEAHARAVAYSFSK